MLLNGRQFSFVVDTHMLLAMSQYRRHCIQYSEKYREPGSKMKSRVESKILDVYHLGVIHGFGHKSRLR